jgi:lipoprotein-anchoring transpeptidase ErfK/SrfK
MSRLRADLTLTAAGIIVAGAVFNFSGSTKAAQIIDVPESVAPAPAEVAAAPAPALSADEDAPADTRVQLVQMPPPPFYSGPSYPTQQQRWRWPWESDAPAAEPRHRREVRPLDNTQRPLAKRRQREQDEPAATAHREPSFSLTRKIRGSYKDKIATLLDQPQSFPQPKGPLLLVVSISKQTVTLYEGGVQFAKSPVSTGTFERPTPLGVFSVLEKQWWHRSNMYSDAPMPFMQRITWDGVALHAGELPGYRASHGCVRLPESFAYRLWYTSNVGARVVITWNDPVPADITHPLLFQPGAAPEPKPAPTPDPAKPPQISPREVENAPVSVMYRPPLGDDLDQLRDRMMTAGINGGEREAIDAGEDNEQPLLQPAISFTGLDGAQSVEAQPVLEMLSARRKTRSNFSRASVPEYEPESVLRPGPVSVFVSRRDSRIYVRKGMQPVFDAPVTIAQPSEPMGTHVFTAASDAGAGKLRWMVVSPTTTEANAEARVSRRRGRTVEAPASPSSTRAASAALDRIGMSQETMDRINGLVAVGASLILSDAGLGRTAAVPDTDFSVVLR